MGAAQVTPEMSPEEFRVLVATLQLPDRFTLNDIVRESGLLPGFVFRTYMKFSHFFPDREENSDIFLPPLHREALRKILQEESANISIWGETKTTSKNFTSHIRIRATITLDYLVFDKILAANGWTMEQLLLDWFRDLNSSHATRDSHQLSGSKQLVSFEIVPNEE